MTDASQELRRYEDSSTLRVRFARDPRAPSLARAAIAGFSRRRDIPESALATLVLLVSELVSNAVLHSDAPQASAIDLCASVLDGASVRVEVSDEGSGFNLRPRDPARLDGGYGLFLVQRQASDWGVEREGGTRVWFVLRDARSVGS